jgi:hypothetical protein
MDPTKVPLPAEKTKDDSGIHFTDAEEPEEVIGKGEVDPNKDGDAVTAKRSEKKSSSGFGYAFLVMILTIALALIAVSLHRRYRIRQMQYREFEVLSAPETTADLSVVL